MQPRPRTVTTIDFGVPAGSFLGINVGLAVGKATLACALALVGSALAAGAEEESKVPSALEEVIVTAQKREQSLQDVGVSVTAFVGERVRELGIVSSTDVALFTPGLRYTVPNGEASQVNFFLRGVGLNDFADANENPVAVYVDDVYRPAMGGLSFQLFDVERVEVLRGPQGSLFGRNTVGGLVHYVSRRPTEELDGYFDIGAGQHNQVVFEGAVGAALTDRASGRLSGARHKHDGYTKNRAGPDYNETDAIAVRGQLAVVPTDAVDALVNVYYSNNEAAVGAWQHQATKFDANGDSVPLAPSEQTITVDCNADGVLDDADERPAAGTDCFGYRDADGNPHAGAYDRDGRVAVRTAGAALTLNWNPRDDLTVTAITGLQDVDRLQSEDTDAGPFPLVMPTFRAATRTFTQELRVAGDAAEHRWLAGLYYFDNAVDGHYTLDLRNLEFLHFDARYRQDTQAIALFGQVEYDLHPDWTLVLGARMASERKELDYLNQDTAGFLTNVIGLPSNIAFDFDADSVGDLAKHNSNHVSAKLAVNWYPQESLLLYGSISRGVKSAGFNVGFLDSNLIFASNTAETIPYNEEALISYEAGFKSTFAGGRARLNGSAFYYDYNDFQTFGFELLNQVIFNADAEMAGAELELSASPAQGWDLALGLAVLASNALDIPNPAGGTRDRTPVAAPKFSATALAHYAWPAWSGELAVQAWGSYQSSLYYDIQNIAVSKQDGYGLSNLRLSYQDAAGRWTVAAFVHNITNVKYLSYTFDFTNTFGFNQQAYGKPRWAGVSVRVEIP